MNKFIQPLIALISGAIFGIGLTLSEMSNPEAVLGFLDVTGLWDPRLLFVMSAALIPTLLIFALILRHANKGSAPLCATKYSLPQSTVIDKPLIIGAICFGMGWGISGYCPGPVITGVFINPNESIPFIVSMIIGINLARWKKQKL